MFTLRCKSCQWEFGTVAEAKHANLDCPRCRRTTAFSTVEVDGTLTLIVNHVYPDRERRETTDQLMRRNRGVPAHKC